MSYCRFSEGDVYLFEHVGGYIECCSCLLAELVPTVMTKGFKGLFQKCEKCVGKGCEECNCKNCNGKGGSCCMMHGSLSFKTFQDAYNHLLQHQKTGHYVPEYAFEELQKDINSGKSPEKNSEQWKKSKQSLKKL